MILDKLPQVQALSVEEKRVLAEEIWEEISRVQDASPIPDEHLGILDDRAASHVAHPERVKSWEDVRKGLVERYGKHGAA